MNDPQLYGIIGAVDDIMDGGFGNTAFDKKLILGHIVLLQQLRQPLADCFIQMHLFHRPLRSMEILYEEIISAWFL